MSRDDFRLHEIIVAGTSIAYRTIWLRLAGGGAVRPRDRLVWRSALCCLSCLRLGYDPGDIDAVLEAQRLGFADAPRMELCSKCRTPSCEECAAQAEATCPGCHRGALS